MTLPKLPRQPIRPREKTEEKELWQPCWECFCCQDYGSLPLAQTQLVIPDHDTWRDQPVLCQKPGCSAGKAIATSNQGSQYDMRFTATICQKIDTLMREDWRRVTQIQHQHIKEKIQQLANKKSLRQRDRTESEEMEAQRKHQEASSINPKQLIAAAQEYLAGLKRKSTSNKGIIQVWQISHIKA